MQNGYAASAVNQVITERAWRYSKNMSLLKKRSRKDCSYGSKEFPSGIKGISLFAGQQKDVFESSPPSTAFYSG